MRSHRYAQTVAAGLALLAGAAAANAAPVSTSPPAIRGAMTYLSTVQCDPGTWTGATSFTYSWRQGAFEFAAGPTWVVPASVMNRSLFCHVTATDAAGATAAADSPAVTATPAPMTLKYRLASPKAGRIRLTGTVGPKTGVRLGTKRSSLTLDRVSGRRLVQINIPPLTIPLSGRFTLNLRDIPGRHTYKIHLNGPDPSVFDSLIKTVKLTVKSPKN